MCYKYFGVLTVLLSGLLNISYAQPASPFIPLPPHESMQQALLRKAPDLSPSVLELALTAAQHASEQGIANNHVLTVIDYSLPANVKRLWVFELLKPQLLFHTYVTHGLGSGAVYTHQFSNHRNSHASSYGIFNTERSYMGSHGLAVRLFGLEPGINDRAAQRAIVMHGAWYAEESFIRRYGRPGRSWGCPAVPDTLITPVVATIQYGSLMVVYYPDQQWLKSSAFLQGATTAQRPRQSVATDPTEAPADPVMFVDTNHTKRYQETKPVVTMPAARYQQIFKQKPPLSRMLRRRLHGQEYIALSPQEFNRLGQAGQADVSLVMPHVYREGGFFKTRLRQVAIPSSFNKLGTLESTTQFIRWIGL